MLISELPDVFKIDFYSSIANYASSYWCVIGAGFFLKVHDREEAYNMAAWLNNAYRLGYADALIGALPDPPIQNKTPTEAP